MMKDLYVPLVCGEFRDLQSWFCKDLCFQQKECSDLVNWVIMDLSRGMDMTCNIPSNIPKRYLNGNKTGCKLY